MLTAFSMHFCLQMMDRFLRCCSCRCLFSSLMYSEYSCFPSAEIRRLCASLGCCRLELHLLRRWAFPFWAWFARPISCLLGCRFSYLVGRWPSLVGGFEPRFGSLQQVARSHFSFVWQHCRPWYFWSSSWQSISTRVLGSYLGHRLAPHPATGSSSAPIPLPFDLSSRTRSAAWSYQDGTW